MKFQGHQPHLSAVLAGEAVGLVEVEEGLWQIRFCDYKVAMLDVVQGKLCCRHVRQTPGGPPSRLGRC